MTLALQAWAMRGRQEASSISLTIQYRSDTFQGDGGTHGELGEEIADGPANEPAFGIEDGEKGEELVGVAADLLIRHVAPPANTGGVRATTQWNGKVQRLHTIMTIVRIITQGAIPVEAGFSGSQWALTLNH